MHLPFSYPYVLCIQPLATWCFCIHILTCYNLFCCAVLICYMIDMAWMSNVWVGHSCAVLYSAVLSLFSLWNICKSTPSSPYRNTVKPLVPSDYFFVISQCGSTPCPEKPLQTLAFVFPNTELPDNCFMVGTLCQPRESNPSLDDTVPWEYLSAFLYICHLVPLQNCILGMCMLGMKL